MNGQADVLVVGLPYVCPYNVNSIMNPILVQCLGLGYFFNLYRGKPLVRPGGAMILFHPVPWEFHQVHHPSYVDFFDEVLAETTDPAAIEAKFEQQYAADPWYSICIGVVRLSRRAPLLHVVLGRARHGLPGRRDLRRGRPKGVVPHGVSDRVHLRRRAGDGGRDRGAESDHHVLP